LFNHYVFLLDKHSVCYDEQFKKLKKMKIISKTFKLLTIFLLVMGITSCSDDDDNNTPPAPVLGNMLDVIESDPQLAILNQALDITGLKGAIETLNPITVLAPTNAAFTTFLGSASIGDVDPDALAAILLNHIIGADLKAADLIGLGTGYASGLSPNTQGQFISIYFNATNGVRFNNAGSVVTDGADIDATNGTLHKIDGVLDLPDLVNHVQNNSDFDTLGVALGLAELTDALRGDEPLTVLAPDNDAFEEFLGETDPTTIIPLLTNVLLNHVIDGSITSAALLEAESGYNTTLAENADEDKLSIYFDTNDGVTFNGISTVATADIIATNGIIHAVGAVVELPTIATFALANPALSGLVAAMTRADEGDNVINWLPAISNPDLLFTVFAPADPAFNVLLEDLGADSLADVDPAAVSGLIALHVVNDANVRSTDLGDLGGIIPTIGGNLSLDGLVITDGDANDINILASAGLVDIQAINGVVHAVDYVIRAAVE
jgi:uncharacterized surface protein with fasciclin (FAS1) repeats